MSSWINHRNTNLVRGGYCCIHFSFVRYGMCQYREKILFGHCVLYIDLLPASTLTIAFPLVGLTISIWELPGTNSLLMNSPVCTARNASVHWTRRLKMMQRNSHWSLYPLFVVYFVIRSDDIMRYWWGCCLIILSNLYCFYFWHMMPVLIFLKGSKAIKT